MKLFGSTKTLIDKTRNGKNVLSLQVVEIVLSQCILLDNQYQQKSEVSFTFMDKKSYACLLNVELSNLVFLKNCSHEFDCIAIAFIDQNGRLS